MDTTAKEELVPFLPGLRVVRGPDWEWGDQDGGEGHVGTVVGIGEPSVSNGGRAVVIQWDCEERPCIYRCGLERKYDLRVLDSAPTGLGFPSVRCYGCRREGISGLQWKCTRCSEYQLCSSCYMADYHSLDHPFNCITTRDRNRVRVLPRSGLKKVEARGLYAEARVRRGRDWKWKDQDGGVGSIGKVVSVKDWKNETVRSIVEVEWPKTHKKNLYRAGHRGKVDLRCTVPGSGGHYYPEHLPILGAVYVSAGAKDFATGDRIKCDLDMEVFSIASAVGEGADDQISMLLDHVGIVEALLQDGDLYVRYPNNSLLPVSPQGANKVDVPFLHRGDVVRMIDDMAKMYSLQKGHGEWVDDMALSLSQLGVVLRVMPSGDVRVATCGKKWMMNPLCLVPAPDDAPPLIIDDDDDVDLETRMRLLSLSHAGDPDVLILAAAAGDISTMRNFLQGAPDKVDSVYEGKTALHVAIEEGSPTAVKLLLEYKANLELQDKGGEKPLHACAFVKSLECAKLLLDAGVDVNCRNAKDNTPLMVAAALGHYSILKFFIAQANIDINAQDYSGKTALHHSVSTHRSLSVALLLDAGADPTLFNFLGFASIHDAAGLGFLVAMEEFMTRFPQYADFKRMEDENTALHIAASNDKLEVLKYLCSLPHVDLNVRNNRTHTPLHCAIIGGYGTMVEALVGYGADINAADLEGNTALHILLIKKFAKPPSQELTPHIVRVQRDMQKILGTSSVPHYMALVCFLVQQGADTHARNRRGQTVMDIIPKEMAPAIMNFINDVDRGSFHGSLRGGNGVVGVNAPHQVNRPLQPVVIPSQGASHSPEHVDAESAPKHNIGNQETPQQQSTLSSISDANQQKPAPPTNQSSSSSQLQSHLVQLEESLKEKTGFPLQSHSSQRSSEQSDTASKGESSISLHLEDSNKSAPSEELSALAPGNSGHYATMEGGLHEPLSGWNQQQTLADGSKSAESVLCFLCDEEPSNVKFIPCGHTVMCSKCAVRTKRCPQCQAGITEKLKLS